MPETPETSPKARNNRRPDSRPVSPHTTIISTAIPTASPRTTNPQSSTFKSASTANPFLISTPSSLVAQAAPRHDSTATTASSSSLTSATSSISPGRGRPTFTVPHPRDLTPKGRRNSLAHRRESSAERVAELTATFKVSIPRRRRSTASDSSVNSQSTTSLQQAAQDAQAAKKEEADKKRRELGNKLARALENGDVVVAPASTIDERKLREVRLDSAVNLGSTSEVPLRLSTSRSKSGTESGDITIHYPSTSKVLQNNDAAAEKGGVKIDGFSWERQEAGRGEGEVPIVGRAYGGPSYNPSHRLGRKNSSLAMASAKAAGVKHVVIAPPPGNRGFGKAKLDDGSGQTDGTGDGRLSHAALLRLPPAAAATKSQALLSEGPLPRRRKSSARSLRNERDRERSRSRERKGERPFKKGTGTPSDDEDDEEGSDWDEDSLLQLTDWWRQVLAAGATPSAKEMAMMDSFLAEFMKEEMPRVDMVLRTRLHRLLVAIIDGAEIRGEGEEEERFHELAHKASLLERRWMKATRGRLFGMERERRDIMFGRSGRLNAVKPWSKGEERETRWVTERNERAGMADVEPGAWWLNTTCAYRDGMIGNTAGYVSNFKQHAHPTLVLEVGEEFPTSNLNVTRYINEGSIYYMLLPLMSTLDKPIRVLRNWTLKSKLAPPAGLRFDGWYQVLSYSHKRVSMEEDVFRVEVLLARKEGQITMARILMVPSPSMLDEWEEYLAIRDDEMRREKSVGEYEEWHRREREGELEREMWLCERAEEEARAAEGGEAEVVEAWCYPPA